MRILSVRVVACAMLAILAAACGGEGGPSRSELVDRARAIVDDAVAMRFEEVRDALDPRVAEQVSAESLRQAWDDFVSEHGPVLSVGEPETTESDGTTTVIFPLEMEDLDGEARITFQNDTVTGLQFVEEGEPTPEP